MKNIIKAQFLFLMLLISCTSNKDDFNSRLLSNLKKEGVVLDPNLQYNFVIITDKDCIKCFDDVAKLSNDENKLNIGLYYARDSVNFKKKLIRTNPEVKWKLLKNRNLIKDLENKLQKFTPFYVLTSSEDIISIK